MTLTIKQPQSFRHLLDRFQILSRVTKDRPKDTLNRCRHHPFADRLVVVRELEILVEPFLPA